MRSYIIMMIKDRQEHFIKVKKNLMSIFYKIRINNLEELRPRPITTIKDQFF